MDPTARSITLADNRDVLLVDTVGFIRKLPTHLIQAFKSTLEEAVLADVLLHVVDTSSGEMDQQMTVVNHILEELGAVQKPVITVYNKIDARNGLEEIPVSLQASKESVEISALTGQGVEDLLKLMEQVVPGKKVKVKICIPYAEGRMVASIHENGDVLSESYSEEGTVMDVLVDQALFGKVKEFMLGE